MKLSLVSLGAIYALTCAAPAMTWASAAISDFNGSWTGECSVQTPDDDESGPKVYSQVRLEVQAGQASNGERTFISRPSEVNGQINTGIVPGNWTVVVDATPENPELDDPRKAVLNAAEGELKIGQIVMNAVGGVTSTITWRQKFSVGEGANGLKSLAYLSTQTAVISYGDGSVGEPETRTVSCSFSPFVPEDPRH